MIERTLTTFGIVACFFLAFYLGVVEILLVSIAMAAIVWEVLRFDDDGCWGVVVMVQMMGLFTTPLISDRELAWLMVIVGAGDVMAIIGGRFLNPLPSWRPFPNISKGKTVMGYTWGVAAAVATGWGFHQFWPVPLGGWLFPFIFYLAAAAGDLLGSKWKRSFGIKDSGEGLWTGKILPGHGGFVDRFGALALVLWLRLFLEIF